MPKKGYKQTKEHKKNTSIAMKRKQNALGYKHTEKAKKKMSEAKKGYKLTKEHKQKIGKANRGNHNALGYKHTSEAKEKMRQIGLERIKNGVHNNWKGDNVSYRGLHQWVVRRSGKAKQCEHCNKKLITPKSIHWANKSGKYLRDLTDWIALCVPCHKKYDKALRQGLTN